jgi:putative salt-induced outer membrane protein
MNKKIVSKICILIIFSTMSYALDIDKHLELSYVQTSGNSNTTTFSSKLQGTAALSQTESIKAKGSVLYSKNENSTSANKYNLELDYNHMISEKLYSYMGISYIKDELSDYDYRLNIGPGLGYKLLEDEIQTIDIQGGLDYAYDKYNSGSTTDNYLAGKTELNYKYRFSPTVDFKQMISYLESFEDGDKYFATSDSSIGVKMTQNLSLGVSYSIDYTNKTNKENTDKKFLTSLIVDF